MEGILCWASPDVLQPPDSASAVQSRQSGTENPVRAARVPKASELGPGGHPVLPRPQESQGPSPCGTYLRVFLWLWEEEFTPPYGVGSAGESGHTGLGCWEGKSSSSLLSTLLDVKQCFSPLRLPLPKLGFIVKHNVSISIVTKCRHVMLPRLPQKLPPDQTKYSGSVKNTVIHMRRKYINNTELMVV